MVRNLFFRHVELFAFERETQLATLDEYLDDPPNWPQAMDDYFDEYADLGVDMDARSGDLIHIQENMGFDGPEQGIWLVRQTLDDSEKDHGWAFTGEVDLAQSNEYGEVRLRALRVVEG